MGSGATRGQLEVDGRRLNVRNLERVIYPEAGTTKGELLDYYVRVAETMLPHLRDRLLHLRDRLLHLRDRLLHLRDRLLHMHRYPEGVDGPRFWQKACPEHRPEWVPTAPVWSRDKQANIDFCVVNDLPTLLWAVNIGSIELHTSLHPIHDLQRPTTVAFDLDPGEGVGVLEMRGGGPAPARPLRGFRKGGVREDLGLQGASGVRAARP